MTVSPPAACVEGEGAPRARWLAGQLLSRHQGLAAQIESECAPPQHSDRPGLRPKGDATHTSHRAGHPLALSGFRPPAAGAAQARPDARGSDQPVLLAAVLAPARRRSAGPAAAALQLQSLWRTPTAIPMEKVTAYSCSPYGEPLLRM